MLVKAALIAHSLAGAFAADAGPLQPGLTATGDLANAPQAATVAPAERLVESGVATWYRRQRSPNITASGERYNPMGMTAAHRFIPLGTMVRVMDEATGRSVVVRVNDREPPHGARCIDLAEGAAMALGIHHEGWARVKITELGVLPGDEPTEVADAPDEAPAPHRAHSVRQVAAHRRH
jgi:rare lipoprotein A